MLSLMSLFTNLSEYMCVEPLTLVMTKRFNRPSLSLEVVYD